MLFLLLLILLALLIRHRKFWKNDYEDELFFYGGNPPKEEPDDVPGDIIPQQYVPPEASQSVEPTKFVLPPHLTLYGSNFIAAMNNVNNMFSVILIGEDHVKVYERKGDEISLGHYIRQLADTAPYINLLIEYPDKEFESADFYADNTFGMANCPLLNVITDIGLNKPQNINIFKMDIRDAVLSSSTKYNYGHLNFVFEEFKNKPYDDIQDSAKEYFINAFLKLFYSGGNELNNYLHLCDIDLIIDNSSYLRGKDISNKLRIETLVTDFYYNTVRDNFAKKVTTLINFATQHQRQFNGKSISILLAAVDELMFFFRCILDMHVLLVLFSLEEKSINICLLGYGHVLEILKIIETNFPHKLIAFDSKIYSEDMAQIPDPEFLSRLLSK
jgi:hypothetical protein